MESMAERIGDGGQHPERFALRTVVETIDRKSQLSRSQLARAVTSLRRFLR